MGTNDNDAIDRLFEQSPPTMGPTEVAERLGVSNKSVYAWLKEGIIPGYKLGKAWFVIRDELKDTLRRGGNRQKNEPIAATIVIRPDSPESP